MSKTKRRWLIAAAVVAFVGLCAIAWAAEQYYRLEICNFTSRDGDSHGYYVYPDATADSLLQAMLEDYKIGSMMDWRIHKRQLLYDKPQPGYYSFPAKIGDKNLIRRLQLGEGSPVRITWNNQVRTREQLAGKLGHQLLIDSAQIIARLDSDQYMQAFHLNKETAVCLFIPNTYEVYWTISADQLFKRMEKEYNRFWNEARRHAADSIGLTPVEVQTLASIIESETNKKQEYPLIASLYMNRLHKNMHLQACPTVIFATGNFKMRRVLYRHLRMDSPYNTYKYPGLPPGPIRCAQGTTIDAVLHAPKTNYLYMCANPDFSGTHIFSSTYSQHAATAREYQHALDERQISQ